MATKTFKIGLSNTDKQNMAQDVYERVLALTFAEYDSANTYNKGDFVVYDDTLYQCKQDNTTGTWDSSKWQQATLQDLLDDIEGAVAFVNDKANVDGNYPTMTVGAADDLTPYDEESGALQAQPFLLQGTGCGNGEQQVDTGTLALLKEKRGNSVVVNQKLKNPQFSTNSDWQVQFGTLSISDGIASFTADDSEDYSQLIQGPFTFATGHKYLTFVEIKTTAAANRIVLFGGSENEIAQNISSSDWQVLCGIVSSNYYAYWLLRDRRPLYNETLDAVQVRLAITVDLTQWFGSNDNIPAHLLSHPEDFFRYYQGSLAYNEGTLVNANGRYLKAIGRQQWDEEWENGVYSYYDGSKSPNPNYLRNKNPIKVIPNTDYYFKVNGTDNMVLFYDKDGGFIGYDDANLQFRTPSNCCYICFYTNNANYNHDITISIYYDGESGYDQYYPYEELSNIDTGTEVLRSAGSVKDTKAPDGTIARRVGSVDLGTLDWYLGDDGCFTALLNDAKQFNNDVKAANIMCAKYQPVGRDYVAQTNKSIAWKDVLRVKDSAYNDATAFKTAMSGVYLFYELATPTTEQGTTFSENVAIDDFGSMDFGGTNGVPQGASIFYAVDYKAFIDSLYNTLDGDATDIVKESELDSKLATLGYVKLTSVSGYDATKTQVLKNVEGTLTWVTEE